MRQSSANSLTLLLILLVKLLIYSKNRVGPSTDPCGTPEVSAHKEEDTLLITTFCCHLCKNDWIQERFLPFILIFWHLSKAFENPHIPISTCFLELKALAKSSIVIRNWDSQECLFLRPNWAVQMMSFDSR